MSKEEDTGAVAVGAELAAPAVPASALPGSRAPAVSAMSRFAAEHVASLNAEGTISSLPDHFTGTYLLAPNGYVWRRKLFCRHPVTLQTFKNDPNDPLTFWPQNEECIRTFRTYDGYDRASVPIILRFFVEPDFGEWTTLFHDGTFHFKAWWRGGVMVAVTMAQANAMLYRMARAEFRQAMTQAETVAGKVQSWIDDKGSRVTAGLAWVGVALGGWFTWRRTDALTAENRRRIANVEAALEAGKPDPGAVGLSELEQSSNDAA